MFGIGMPELLLILAIALIVIGPKKLPDLAKSLGRAMREFKKATNEFKESIQLDEDMSDVKKAFNGLGEDIKESVSPKKDAEEFKRPDDSKSSDDAVGGKELEAPDTAEAGTDDGIQNVKQAFDQLKDSDGTQAKEASEDTAETEKKEPHGDPVKNDQ